MARPHTLFEAHLDVRDLDRSVEFYRTIVGLEPAYRLEERNVAFLWDLSALAPDLMTRGESRVPVTLP